MTTTAAAILILLLAAPPPTPSAPSDPSASSASRASSAPPASSADERLRYGHLAYFGEASGAPAPINLEELYDRCLRVSCFWLGADPPEHWDTARRELQEWVADGTLRITVGQLFPLHQASEAHRQLESRETHGKLILVPGAVESR